MTEVTGPVGEQRPPRYPPYPDYKESGVQWLRETSAAVTGKIDVREALPR